MSKHFRPWKIDETQLLPASVQDYVPEDHLSRLIVALVRESLDLSEIEASYASGLGQPPFHPGLMTALLLHGYASGIYSSRRIEKAARERADFMMIVAGDVPDFRTISDFRKRHLAALAKLFVQVLKLCATVGLVKLGHVALDGTKIKANASKHKAMSYERMKKREAELQRRSTVGWLPPKPPTPRRTNCTGPGAATRFPGGLPTRRRGSPRFALRRPSWRLRRRWLRRKRRGAGQRPRRSASRKAVRRTALHPSRRAMSPTARSSATSPIRRAACC